AAELAARQAGVPRQRARGELGARRLVARQVRQARRERQEERRVLVVGIRLGGGQRLLAGAAQLAERRRQAGQVVPGPGKARVRGDHLLELVARLLARARPGQRAGQPPARRRRGAIAPEQPPLAVHRRLRRELPLLV